jgi:hypothetical protein
MSKVTVNVSAENLSYLADASIRAGTQNQFASMAVEWAYKAEAYVEKLHTALRQAYIDGGCTEAEAEEMLEALKRGEN